MLFNAATSTDVAERGATVAVLPVGAFEQHGDHLPLTTDTVIACVMANRLAQKYNLLVLPPVTFSCSHEHAAYAGTVSVSAATLIAVVNDVRSSLAQSGIRRLVLINGHGGNYVLSNITQEANVGERQVALFPGSDDVRAARERAGMETNAHDDMHGGEWETSILLHSYPDLVGPTYRENDHDAAHRPYLLTTGMQEYTPSGIIGRPSAATAEKGRAALDSLADSFMDVLKVLSAD